MNPWEPDRLPEGAKPDFSGSRRSRAAALSNPPPCPKAMVTRSPRIDPTSFLHARSSVIGDVSLGPRTSVWPFASIRGDVDPIVLGEASNVQDNCVIHTDSGFPVTIGRNVTLGHAAIVHGATIEDDCLIGIRAVVLNGAKIGRGSLVAAGAVVTPGTVIPPHSLVMGLPAKVVKTDPSLEASNRRNAERYVGYADAHRRGDFGSAPK